MSWLAEDFVHPERVELPTGHHLRPIRESDVDIDYPAVMGSRERLWARFGGMWGWPPAGMTYEADRKDLARHEAEITSPCRTRSRNGREAGTGRPRCSRSKSTSAIAFLTLHAERH
jgi:hypothetical protein